MSSCNRSESVLFTLSWLILHQLSKFGRGNRSNNRSIWFGKLSTTKRYILCNPCIRKPWYSENVQCSDLRMGLGIKLSLYSKLSMLYPILSLISLFSLSDPPEFKSSVGIYFAFSLHASYMAFLPWSPYFVFLLLWNAKLNLLNGFEKPTWWNMVVVSNHRWKYLYCNNSTSLLLEVLDCTENTVCAVNTTDSFVQLLLSSHYTGWGGTTANWVYWCETYLPLLFSESLNY